MSDSDDLDMDDDDASLAQQLQQEDDIEFEQQQSQRERERQHSGVLSEDKDEEDDCTQPWGTQVQPSSSSGNNQHQQKRKHVEEPHDSERKDNDNDNDIVPELEDDRRGGRQHGLGREEWFRERSQKADEQWTRLLASIASVEIILIKTRLSSVITALYSHELHQHGRKAALVTALHEECATLLQAEQGLQNGTDNSRRTLCVFPLEALFANDLGAARKLFPFSALNKLRVILVSNIDATAEAATNLRKLKTWFTDAPSQKRNKLIFTCWGSGNFTKLQTFLSREFRCDISHFDYDAYVASGGEPHNRLWSSSTEIVQLQPGQRASGNLKTKTTNPSTCSTQRFRQAKQIAEAIAATPKLTHVPDKKTKRALLLLFAQFADTLKRPRLISLPTDGENTKVLEWFREVHKDNPQLHVCDPDVPILTFADQRELRGRDQAPAVDANEDEMDSLMKLSSMRRVYKQTIVTSEKMRHNQAHMVHLWPFLSSVLPAVLPLVIGMPVMLLCTLKPSLPAGICGTVTSIENGRRPEVAFALENGTFESLAIEPVTMRSICGTSYNGELWFEVTQLPLAPAFFLEENLLKAIPVQGFLGIWKSMDWAWPRLQGLVRGKPHALNSGDSAQQEVDCD